MGCILKEEPCTPPLSHIILMKNSLILILKMYENTLYIDETSKLLFHYLSPQISLENGLHSKHFYGGDVSNRNRPRSYRVNIVGKIEQKPWY